MRVSILSASRIWRCALLALTAAFFVGNVWLAPSLGQELPLPDGPGREEARKLCAGCHELAKSFSLRQDRAGWQTTMDKMVAFGMKATEQEIKAVLEYVVRHYPADDVPRLKVNKAPAIEFESILSLKRSQAAAIIRYREEHGPFKTIEDLKKVPGLEAAKIDAKKDRLIFQ